MADNEHDQEIKYFVNGEKQESKEGELTAGHILEKAGFTPASDYDLVDDKTGTKYADAEEDVQLKNGEHFTA
jgi:hypothetical protein